MRYEKNFGHVIMIAFLCPPRDLQPIKPLILEELRSLRTQQRFPFPSICIIFSHMTPVMKSSFILLFVYSLFVNQEFIFKNFVIKTSLSVEAKS